MGGLTKPGHRKGEARSRRDGWVRTRLGERSPSALNEFLPGDRVSMSPERKPGPRESLVYLLVGLVGGLICSVLDMSLRAAGVTARLCAAAVPCRAVYTWTVSREPTNPSVPLVGSCEVYWFVVTS